MLSHLFMVESWWWYIAGVSDAEPGDRVGDDLRGRLDERRYG